MGSRRIRRERFFSEHPICCFCGGNEPATEEDHIPARHIFRERSWPEGYVFPACGLCNRESSEDELAMGFLARITISDLDPIEERELEQAILKLHDRRPEWVRGAREVGRVETRQHLRARGLSLQMFGGQEPYLLEFPAELMGAPDRYARKLAKALYYKHAGRILPSDATFRTRAVPNSEFMAEYFPRASFGILNQAPVLTRAGKSLAGQFAYRYALAADGPAAGFVVQFRESIVMVIVVKESSQDCGITEVVGLAGPREI